MPRMSLETLKRELAGLSAPDRRALMGYLASLNLTEEDRRDLARKIDDRNPANWMTLEELDAKLAALDAKGE